MPVGVSVVPLSVAGPLTRVKRTASALPALALKVSGVSASVRVAGGVKVIVCGALLIVMLAVTDAAGE